MVSYAVILTHNRPELLLQTVQAIASQVDYVRVVDNASSPAVQMNPDEWPLNVVIYRESLQPPNLSLFWNRQFDLIEKHALERATEWEIAVLCDDSIAPEGWFDAVKSGIRQTGAAAGSTHAINEVSYPIFTTAPNQDIFQRMCGWAFVIAGERGLRADESMHWWYLDDDLGNLARVSGGLVICPGPVVRNELPGAWTNAKQELSDRAGADRAVFLAKWGYAW